MRWEDRREGLSSDEANRPQPCRRRAARAHRAPRGRPRAEPPGALHEVAGDGNGAIYGAAAALFAAGIAARLRGKILWCVTRPDLFALALAQARLAPDRVIFVGPATRLRSPPVSRKACDIAVLARSSPRSPACR
jgi:hypothetical protein